ncbi:MAG: bifunctional adenosylcobinamide kinase/adenosylcobinamide-phosphate guanylyltransferase [Chloroflexota bacterium]
MGKQLTLILGGARSGKSAYAEQYCKQRGERVLFVATATASDEEMKLRIANHRISRPADWLTLEAPRGVGQAIRRAPLTPLVLVDCLTLLASNVLLGFPEEVEEQDYQRALDGEMDELLAAYAAHPGEWLIVSNEVGLGLVPPYRLGRLFRDGLGRANQRLAAAADTLLLMVAGIPLRVKGE